MMPGIGELALGLGGSAIITLGGLRARALAPSGGIAAILIGTAVFACGGLAWAAVMVGFFVLSSGLSKLGAAQKKRLAGVAEQGSRRDVRQVVANGGIPALLAIASLVGYESFFFALFVGAMAAANADTWSTEIGTLSRRPPRSILTGRAVAAGTSGGVSPLGLLASLAGGLAIGGIAAAAKGDAWYIAAGTMAGIGGSVIDSLLGASIQRLCWCPRCEQPTERLVHRCGARTVRKRGLSFVDNDIVNLLTSFAGALFGAVAYQFV